MKYIFTLLLICAGSTNLLFAQDTSSNKLSLKVGANIEKSSEQDLFLHGAVIELDKRWTKRWSTSLDVSAGKSKKDIYNSAHTYAANLNAFYSVLSTKRNALKVGTGLSYR